jgi:hypothetical protein
VLHIDGNDLYRLPTGLSALHNLSELHIGSNQLLVLPPWLCRMTRLVRLHAPFNKISNMLPVTRCTGLQELNLSHNALTSLPSEIQALRVLVDLDVSNNELKSLPSELRALPRLMLLKMTGNRIAPKQVHAAVGAAGCWRCAGAAARPVARAAVPVARRRRRRSIARASSSAQPAVPLWVDCAFAKPDKKKVPAGALRARRRPRSSSTSRSPATDRLGVR